MAIFLNFVSGLIFGVGLILSGMIDPAKVLNFLDVAGTWDPSLAFVMAGAITVTAIGYAFVAKWKKPVYAEGFNWTDAKTIDGPLLAGAAIFGLGWGLAGLCPGPAIASLALSAPGTLAFVPAMVIGIFAGGRLFSGRNRTPVTS